MARLSGAAEKPIYEIEKVDAMAWAVTNFPKVALSALGVPQLRKSGVLGSSPLGRR